MRLLLIMAALSLTACAGKTPPKTVIVTQEVKVPVAVTCVPADVRPAPTYPDTDEAIRAAPGPAERYLLIAAGRLLRIQRSAEVEPVVEGCRSD